MEVLLCGGGGCFTTLNQRRTQEFQRGFGGISYLGGEKCQKSTKNPSKIKYFHFSSLGGWFVPKVIKPDFHPPPHSLGMRLPPALHTKRQKRFTIYDLRFGRFTTFGWGENRVLLLRSISIWTLPLKASTKNWNLPTELTENPLRFKSKHSSDHNAIDTHLKSNSEPMKEKIRNVSTLWDFGPNLLPPLLLPARSFNFDFF